MDKKNLTIRKGDEQEVKDVRRKIALPLCIAGALLVVALIFVPLVIWAVAGAPMPDDGDGAIDWGKPQQQVYSVLTGLPVADEAENKLPTFCVQVPNGTDGARPQAGLDKAGVIFEAIAEKGITRFAAIFQNVNDIPVIGPIRSLRLYYLQWDTPFDCTVVHDGGADDALAAVKSHKDFTAFGGFVWRSSTNKVLNRRWNNEFTSGELLLAYNAKRGYGESRPTGFTRSTPEEAEKARVEAFAANPLDIDSETEKRTDEMKAAVTNIRLTFGNMPNYNPVYDYDAATNTYKRSYASGALHEIYDCSGKSGKITPENVCEKKQLAPSVVVAMMVEEKRASDNYHENITATGSGKAYVFQGGQVVEGTWKKATVSDQIKFYDADGVEVKLAPGQVIVSAVPNYGKVEYK